MEYSCQYVVSLLSSFFKHQNYATNAQTLATVGSLLFTAQTFIFQIITDKKEHFFFLTMERKKGMATLWARWISLIFSNCAVCFLLASFELSKANELFLLLAIVNVLLFIAVLIFGVICFKNYQSIFINQFQQNSSLLSE